MSRYLPPENAGHREHAAPADERAEEVSLSDLRLPEPAAPQSPQMPPPAPLEFAPSRWVRLRRRPLRLLRRRRPATLKALTLSPNRDRRLRQPPQPSFGPPPGPAAQPSFGPPPPPGSRTRRPGRRRRALSCQRVAARQATRRLRSRRARSLTSPTRCRPRRSSGHRRALTLRNAGRRGRTFGLPARHPPGMSRSKRS